MQPKIFQVNGKKLYFLEISKVIDSNPDISFFEFYIIKDEKIIKKILVKTKIIDDKQTWSWFVHNDLLYNKITYHYKDLVMPEVNFDNFVKYVMEISPKYIDYIFFNYII